MLPSISGRKTPDEKNSVTPGRSHLPDLGAPARSRLPGGGMTSVILPQCSRGPLFRSCLLWVNPIWVVGVSCVHRLNAALEPILDSAVLTLQRVIGVFPLLVVPHACDASLMQRLHAGKTGTNGRVHQATVNSDAEPRGTQKRILLSVNTDAHVVANSTDSAEGFHNGRSHP